MRAAGAAAIGDERATTAGRSVADERGGIHAELGDGAFGLGRAFVDRAEQAVGEIFLPRFEAGEDLRFGRQVRIDQRARLERCLLGDRRSAVLQQMEAFRRVRLSPRG